MKLKEIDEYIKCAKILKKDEVNQSLLEKESLYIKHKDLIDEYFIINEKTRYLLIKNNKILSRESNSSMSKEIISSLLNSCKNIEVYKLMKQEDIRSYIRNFKTLPAEFITNRCLYNIPCEVYIQKEPVSDSIEENLYFVDPIFKKEILIYQDCFIISTLHVDKIDRGKAVEANIAKNYLKINDLRVDFLSNSATSNVEILRIY